MIRRYVENCGMTFASALLLFEERLRITVRKASWSHSIHTCLKTNGNRVISSDIWARSDDDASVAFV